MDRDMEYFNEEDRDEEIVEDEIDEWDEEDEDLDHISFVCEDCDYRWEEASQEEVEEGAIVCPMCGSINVTQL
jgi:rubrerythrin